MSDWIDVLRAEVERTSQAAVAKRLGYSGSVVSQVLSGTYAGRLDNVERAVRDVIGVASVPCPVLGSIHETKCAELRNRPFAATNPSRVAMWRACRTCPLNPKNQD